MTGDRHLQTASLGHPDAARVHNWHSLFEGVIRVTDDCDLQWCRPAFSARANSPRPAPHYSAPPLTFVTELSHPDGWFQRRHVDREGRLTLVGSQRHATPAKCQRHQP